MKGTRFTLLGLVALMAAGTVTATAARSRRGGAAEANKAVVRRIFEEAFNQGNTAVVDELLAPDAVGHGNTPAEDTRGGEPLKQFVTGIRTSFPDVHYTVDDQIAEGDQVATRFTMHGTQKGEYRAGPGAPPLAPTGKAVTTTGIVINRLAGGKITEIWVNTDQLGLLRQLGVLPPPGAPTTSVTPEPAK